MAADDEGRSVRVEQTEREIISFKLTREDLSRIGQVANRLQVTTGVNVEEPGAFTIRNHSFTVEEPGAFVIRNHNFSTKTPGAYTIRNYRFSEE